MPRKPRKTRTIPLDTVYVLAHGSVPGLSWWVSRLAWWAMFLALGQFLLNLYAERLAPALGSDSLIYHLPLPAFWLQGRPLAIVDLPFHDGMAQFSPMFSELCSYLLMRLTGDDGLCFLVQPAAMLAMLWFFYRSARLLGAGKANAGVLVGLLVAFPPFVRSYIMVNSDIVLTAGAAVFLYGLLAMRLPKGRPLLWAILGLGLLLATKYIGVIYAAVGVLVLAGPAWAYLCRRRRRDGKLPAGELACSAAALLAGSAFLIRNAAIFGNPMYPAVVKLGPLRLFAGLYDTSVLARYGLTGQRLLNMFAGGKATFGIHPAWAAVLLGCLAISLPMWLLRARRRRGTALLAVFVYPVLAGGAYFAVTPFWMEHRLLFPVYYCLWLALAYVSGVGTGRLARHARMAVTLLLLAGLGLDQFFFWLEGAWQWLMVLLAAAAALIPWPRRVGRRFVLPGAALAVAVAAVTGPMWYGSYRQERLAMRPLASKAYSQVGAGWRAVDRLTAGKGGVAVAYAGTPLIYPLFGPDLANRVHYVPLSESDRPQPTRLRPQLGPGEPTMEEAGVLVGLQLARQRRAMVDEAYWLEGLKQRHVEVLYLVDQAALGGVKQELGIIARHGERFELFFRAEAADQGPSQDVYVYRVKSE